MTDIQWMIGGEAGYGIMTTGVMMAKIMTRLGMSVFDYVEYPSLIRGGHNAYYVRCSDRQIYSQKETIDILVALNRETIDQHKTELSPHAVILYDSNSVTVREGEFDSEKVLVPVPLVDITKELKVDRLMVNTIAVGASMALFYDDYAVMEKILQDTFGHKGEKIVAINVATSQRGFDYVKERYAFLYKQKITKKPQKSLLISGAEAVAFGAIRAGLKFTAIYPMTPINTIMTTIVEHSLKYGIVVKEPEDEIGGINMAIGASYAGVRSMVATSGGGFSLMVESLGLAAQSETPLVIIMGMRPGPATGMPTWTDQGDLRFVLHAAQGDFPRIVLAPGDFREAFSLTMRAFNLAEKYQLQVIVLVDKYLMEGHGTVDMSEMKADNSWFKLERGKLMPNEALEKEKDYKRYKLTEDGVSPRSIPGQKGGISLTGSDEHDEHGLYNEEAEVRRSMMEKRFQKLETAKSDIFGALLIGDKYADVTVLSFGSTKLPIMDAIQRLKEEGVTVNLFHVVFLSPLPVEQITTIMKKAKKTLVIEANFTGQLEGLIREKTGLQPTAHLRKYDGRPFYPEEIVEKVKEML